MSQSKGFRSWLAKLLTWLQGPLAAFPLAAKWVFIPGVALPALLYILLAPVLPGWAVALVSTGLLLCLALLATLWCHPLTSLKQAFPESYNALCLQLITLRSALAPFRDLTTPATGPDSADLPLLLRPSDPLSTTAHPPAHIEGQHDRQLQYTLLQHACTHIDALLQKPAGLFWTSARGYLDLWTSLHQAQEALVTFLPASTLIDETQKDLCALAGSDIPESQQQITLLTQAIQTLGSQPDASSQTPAQSASPDNQQASALLASALTEYASSRKTGAEGMLLEVFKRLLAPLDTPPEPTEEQARSTIRTARYKIHSFLDTKWAGLVRLRISLMQTTLLTFIFTYALLLLPLFYAAPVNSVIAFTSFYLVGAVCGLFLRLFTEWKSNESSTDDYGLTRDRIMITPLLCGVAAVGGVLIASIFNLSFNPVGLSGGSTSPAPQVVATVSVSGSSVQVTVVPAVQPASPSQGNSLDKIFNLQTNPGGLIWAALFGLVPNLLINILRQQAQEIQVQIQNAQPDSSGNTASSSSP